MQAVKQPGTSESFYYRQALKMFLLSDELWLIKSVALFVLLQAFKGKVTYTKLTYYIKRRVHGIKT